MIQSDDEYNLTFPKSKKESLQVLIHMYRDTYIIIYRLLQIHAAGDGVH